MTTSGSPHAAGSDPTWTSLWQPRSFSYTFPLVPPPGVGLRHHVYGLAVAGNGAPSVILRSRARLDQKGALKKLSVALALLGIYASVGLTERVPGGIGEFVSTPSQEEYEEHSYPEEVRAAINQLEQANDPYQIQACFTLSRCLALVRDPECSIIEFFKLIELYLKQLAWAGRLDAGAARNVLVDKIIFSKRVKEDLKAREILAEPTVELIYMMKEVRNKFVGHGGMRPTLADLFGDPEDNRQLLEHSDFKYDPELQYGPGFFERILNDVTLVGGFLFAKMQGLEPLICVRPEHWSQSSARVREVLTAEGARWIGPDQVRFQSD